jgi:hypothetical protein
MRCSADITGGSKRGRIGFEELRAQLGDCALPVVASDVIEDAAVQCLDEVYEDECIDELPVPAVSRRDEFLVATGAGEERPQRSGHGDP